MTDEIKQQLIRLALTAREKAYAPYSHYNVGAAILADDGRLFGGCNVENASYGLTNCAERTAIFTTDDGGSPCGACRQVISEFSPKDGTPVPVFLIDSAGNVIRETSIAELLPFAFSF